MHRAYQPILPSHNKLLQQKWDDTYYNEHRRKVSGNSLFHIFLQLFEEWLVYCCCVQDLCLPSCPESSDLQTENGKQNVCMGFRALLTAMVSIARSQNHQYQCQCVGYMSYSRLLDLRTEERRVLRLVKPPRCGKASKMPECLRRLYKMFRMKCVLPSFRCVKY